MKNFKNKKGFTLLEILLVVGIIAILAGIVIIAINPSKQLADARNAQRKSDVRAISDAIYQYTLDPGHTLDNVNNGGSPAVDENGTCNASSTETDVYDMQAELVPTYLADIPIDPQTGDRDNFVSHYMVVRNSTTNRVVVCAPDTENISVISIIR